MDPDGIFLDLKKMHFMTPCFFSLFIFQFQKDILFPVLSPRFLGTTKKWHDGRLWASFSQVSDFSHHQDQYKSIAEVSRDLGKIWLFTLVDRILTYRPFCAGFGWIRAPPPAVARSPFFHQSHKIVTWIFDHSSALVSARGENCCRSVFSTHSLTFEAPSGGQNYSFDQNWQTGWVVTTTVAFTGSPTDWGQNLREDQVEICLCAKIQPNSSSGCCVKLFQSWSLSSVGGGRTAHFGLCVAVARSCVGLVACRVGKLEGPRCTCHTTPPAPALQPLLLLPKDDCDRVRGA